MQSAEHVTNDGSAHAVVVAEFGFNDAKFTENQTSRDSRFDLFVNALPKPAVLQRSVDLVGYAQVELADVAAQRRD